MTSTGDFRQPEPTTPTLPRVLEWALPEPVVPSGVQMCDSSGPCTAGADAVILTTPHWYQRGRAEPDFSAYGWQRSFRAFPNPESPRFLYPGDGRFRSFPQLVRPRSSAAVKMLASRVITAVPAVVDVRSHEFTLATRRESELVRRLRRHFDESRTAVYVGNRHGPPRPAIWGQGEDGAVSVVARYRSGSDEAARLEREHHFLRRLQDVPSIASSVPESYGLMSGHLGTMLVTEGFDGEPGPLSLGPPEDGWLDSCVTGPPLAASRSPLVQGVVAAAEPHALLRDIAAAASAMLGPARVPSTIVHGDFVPWNILRVGESIKVFDWESGIMEGIPGWDRLYFQVRVGLLLNRWDRTRLAAHILNSAVEGHPHYDALSWRAVLLILLVHLYLIDDVPSRRHELETVLTNELAAWWKAAA